MKGFPYSVLITLHKDDFRNMLNWLHTQGHVLRETMMFGGNHHVQGSNSVEQAVLFRDKAAAAMFKLTWG